MRPVLVLALVIAGCGDNLHPPVDLPADEMALRAKLGIPADATRVIVFGQSAHFDIDWQHTFDDYYTQYVGDALLGARAILDAQPRAFYSVAEMAYLAHHLAVHPEEQDALRAASQRGALRIVGGGMTSPDTLLPETELLARDFLYGIQFAEDALDAHPHAAWLPDSFGHGAAAPDVLAAAGYTSVGFARVDGAPTFGEELKNPDLAPVPGSTAELLARLGSADFVWRGAGGATIVAHFMAGSNLYCQGDNLDYKEPLEPVGGHIGPFRGDDPAFTDASVDRYIAELAPTASTPYLFVPVGCDFALPKPRLVEYLDGYDVRRYGDTGVYAVAAPFDDFADLVAFHRDALPTIDGELAPYFMGFYGSRADIKRGARDAARPLFVAETFATLLGAEGKALVATARPTLEQLTWTDHHDFVTGTSADAVVSGEQLPLLQHAESAGDTVLQHVADALASRMASTSGTTDRALAFNAASDRQLAVTDVLVATTGGATPAVHAVASGALLPLELVRVEDTVARFRTAVGVAPFGWQMIDVVPGAATPPTPQVSLALLDGNGAPASGAAIARVELANARVHARWDRTGGAFALVSLQIDGHEAIAQPSLVVHDYHDDGGLWRMGHEMPGCTFTPLAPGAASDTVQVIEQGALRVRVAFVGADATREVTLDAGLAALDVAVVTGAAQGTTRTLAIALAAPAGAQLATSVPGGAAVRVPERLFTPTYWAAVGWAQVGDWAVLLRQSTGVRMDEPGALELVAARDARQETCDVLGGTGSDPGTHRIEWRIAPAHDAIEAERAAQVFDRPLATVSVTGAGTGLDPAGSLVAIDGGGVVTAIKPADRGDGVIVRAVLLAGAATLHLAPPLAHGAITATDLAERDLGPRAAGDDVLLDPAAGSIVTLRLR